jgi:methyl-accepting chemotaxis protein
LKDDLKNNLKDDLKENPKENSKENLKKDAKSERPLDHTAARLVAELAAALLPRLQDSVSEELSELLESLPGRANESMEKTLLSLNRVKDTADRMGDLLDGVKASLEQMTEGAFRGLDRLPGQLESLSAQIQNTDDRAGEMRETLQSFVQTISAWEGVLKADGRAHTRELSELSAEILEILKDTQTALLRTLKETSDREAARHDAQTEQLLLKNSDYIIQKLTYFEKKLIFATGFFAVITCVVLSVLATILLR